MSSDPNTRELPSRFEALLFGLKTRAFQCQRAAWDLRHRPARHPRARTLEDAPVLGSAESPLWTQTTPAEFPLTAGKIENLRIAARALDGIEVPAGRIFSFWRQLGRTTRSRGYTIGRELREGCLVPSRGGGLCQLSGLLYQAALAAGLEIVERHAHSRTIPGSDAEKDRDATVFWNYVDLRFRAPVAWRLEVRLNATTLTVRIRSGTPIDVASRKTEATELPRPPATGDCLTCNQTECFRHPSATTSHAPALGHSTFLLDARWPEFDRWCAGHAREGDHWLTPLDGHKWRKPNYRWNPPGHAVVHHATIPTLRRSIQQRRLPAQGAIRQAALLRADADLASYYNHRISPQCRHLVVSQNLLPHLWQLGTLGGRTFDVLVTRWPLAELHRRLDTASRQQPDSPTLGDFRADDELVRSETEALEQAGRLITPHRALASHFGHRAWLIDWDMPHPTTPGTRPPHDSSTPLRLFLPCSPLGRKGIHELAAALEGSDHDLLVLGRAREDAAHDPLESIRWHPATLTDLPTCHALILPAWVEHQPRLALRALAHGIPVIATSTCGLPKHPLLHTIPEPDPTLLADAIQSLHTESPAPPATADHAAPA